MENYHSHPNLDEFSPGLTRQHSLTRLQNINHILMAFVPLATKPRCWQAFKVLLHLFTPGDDRPQCLSHLPIELVPGEYAGDDLEHTWVIAQR